MKLNLSHPVEAIKKGGKPYLEYIKENTHNGILYRGTRQNSTNTITKLKSNLENRTPKDVSQLIHDIANKIFTEKFGWPVRNGVMCTGYRVQSASYGAPHVFLPIGQYDFVWSPMVKDFYDVVCDHPYHLREYKEDLIADKKDLLLCMIEYLALGANADIDRIYEEMMNMYNDVMCTFLPGTTQTLRTRQIKAIDKMNKMGNPARVIKEITERLIREKWTTELNSYTDKDLRKAIANNNEISFKCQEYYLINTNYYDEIKDELYNKK